MASLASLHLFDGCGRGALRALMMCLMIRNESVFDFSAMCVVPLPSGATENYVPCCWEILASLNSDDVKIKKISSAVWVEGMALSIKATLTLSLS